jgi:hypothetical protein
MQLYGGATEFAFCMIPRDARTAPPSSEHCGAREKALKDPDILQCGGRLEAGTA